MARREGPAERTRRSAERCARAIGGRGEPARCVLLTSHAGPCHDAPVGECMSCGAFAVRNGTVLVCMTGASSHETQFTSWSPRSVIVGCRDMLREAARQLRAVGLENEARMCELHAECAQAALGRTREADVAGGDGPLSVA